jgi:hypothetical protein
MAIWQHLCKGVISQIQIQQTLQHIESRRHGKSDSLLPDVHLDDTWMKAGFKIL